MRKYAKKTRGRPFEKGNPGRPRGSRNKSTLAAEALFEGEAEALSRKAVELALNGNVQALRICLDRVLAPRCERPIRVRLPPLGTAADVSKVSSALIVSAAQGELTPSEAASLMQLLESYVRTLLASNLEDRLSKLEAEQK